MRGAFCESRLCYCGTRQGSDGSSKPRVAQVAFAWPGAQSLGAVRGAGAQAHRVPLRVPRGMTPKGKGIHACRMVAVMTAVGHVG